MTDSPELKPGDFAAFPIQASDAHGSLYAEQGLTKREYIAAMLMPHFLNGQNFKGAAADAVLAADALMAQCSAAAKEPKS